MLRQQDPTGTNRGRDEEREEGELLQGQARMLTHASIDLATKDRPEGNKEKS
jgi:hypothetical protein